MTASRLPRELMRASFDRHLAEVQIEFPNMPLKGPGRRHTVQGVARRRAAEELGVPESEIRWAEWREESTRVKKHLRNPSGIPLTEEFLRDTSEVFDLTRRLVRDIATAKAMLTKCQSNQMIHKQRFALLQEQLERVSTMAKLLTPSMLCPWCKGIGGIQEHCGACLATGYIVASQVAGVPASLAASHTVMVGGKEEPISKHGVLLAARSAPPDAWGLE